MGLLLSSCADESKGKAASDWPASDGMQTVSKSIASDSQRAASYRHNELSELGRSVKDLLPVLVLLLASRGCLIRSILAISEQVIALIALLNEFQIIV
ncbi:MAG: hypothetical protein OXD50_01730 [Chloroflexi bacterium]|nr:hypothetical protein [Chloroflexota bacterium]